ncbi:MAG: hypothetical protein ACI9XB_004158 [Gammaproteobacteria bacterium]|jgi:hypothetical protein
MNLTARHFSKQSLPPTPKGELHLGGDLRALHQGGSRACVRSPLQGPGVALGKN